MSSTTDRSQISRAMNSPPETAPNWSSSPTNPAWSPNPDLPKAGSEIHRLERAMSRCWRGRLPSFRASRS